MSISGQIGRLLVSLEADTSNLEAGMRRGESIVQGGAARIGGLLKAGIAVGAGVTTFNAGLVATRRLFDVASDAVIGFNSLLDDTGVTWEVFLGNVDLAQAKIKELYAFAAKTPFDFQQVQEGALVLQLLSGGVLNTTENLTKFGDAAIAVAGVAGTLGESFQQVTFYAARLFSELTNGDPIGRTVLRMSQLGLITDKTVNTMRLLQEEGATVNEVYQVFLSSLDKFQGIGAKVEQNFSVAIATFTDYARKNLADVGRPIFDLVRELLVGVNKLLAPGNVNTQNFIKEATDTVRKGVADIRAFFLRADVQDTIRTWAFALKEFGQTALEVLKQVAAVAGPLVAGFVRGLALLNNATGANVIGLGLLLLTYRKFSGGIGEFVKILTGQVTLFNRQYDAQGRVLTRSQIAARNAELHARALAIEAEALNRVTVATAKLAQQKLDEAAASVAATNATNGVTNALAVQAAARTRQATAHTNAGTARAAKMTVDADITALGGLANAEALAKEYRATTDLAVAQATLAKATADEAAASRVAATSALAEAKAKTELARVETLLANAQARAAANKVRVDTAGEGLRVASANRAAVDKEIAESERRIRESERRVALAEQRGRDKAIKPAAVKSITAKETSLQTFERDAIAKASARQAKLTDLETKAKDRLLVVTTALDKKETEVDARKSVVQTARTDLSAAVTQAKTDTAALVAAQAARTKAQNDLDKTNDVIARGGPQAVVALQQRKITTAALTAAEQEVTKADRAATASAREVTKARKAQTAATEELALAQAQTTKLTGVLAGAETDLKNASAAATTTTTRLAGLGNAASALFSRMGQVALIVGTTIVALNSLSEAFFKVDVGTLISNMIKYGDTLAYARQELEKFLVAQRGLPQNEVNANYKKQLDDINTQLELAKKKRTELDKLAAQNPSAGALPFTDSGRQLISNAFAHPGDNFGGLDRQIDNLQKLYDDLLKSEADYGKKIDEINKKKAAGVELTKEEKELVEGKNRLEGVGKGIGQGATSARGAQDPDLERAAQGLTDRIASRGAFVFSQGEKLFQQFTAGFTGHDQELYGKVDGIVQELLKRFSPTGKLRLSDQITLGAVEPLIAAAITEIDKVGTVSTSTFAKIKAELGDAFDTKDLEDFFHALEAASAAERRMMGASIALAQAQAQLGVATAASELAISAIEKKINGLQKDRDKDQRKRSDELQGLSDTLAALQDEAEGVAAAFAKTIKSQQDAIDAQQKIVDGIQKASAQHQGAYSAILSGETAEYLRQQAEVDELTKDIVKRWEAELAGARRLKDATADRSDALGRQNRKDQLAFNTQIEAARARGDFASVARLTKQRDDYNKRAQRGISLAEQQAAVAQDEFDVRAKALTQEAKAQADKEKEQEVSAQKEVDRLTAIKDITVAAAATEAASYAEKVKSQQHIIDLKTREAKDEAQRYDDLIAGEQTRLDDAKEYWKGEIDAAKKRVDAATLSLNNADAEYKLQLKITETISQRIKDQNAYMASLLGFVDGLEKLGYFPKAVADDIRKSILAATSGTQVQSPIDGNTPETPKPPAGAPPSGPSGPGPKGQPMTYPAAEPPAEPPPPKPPKITPFPTTSIAPAGAPPLEMFAAGFGAEFAKAAFSGGTAAPNGGVVYNQNAPLAETLVVREEADIDKIAAAFVEKQRAAWEQQRRRGTTPGRMNA